MVAAAILSVIGLRWAMPWVRKPSCWRTISVETLRMVWARWSRLLVSQLAVARQSERNDFSAGSRVFLVTVA
jgi:hypothetical protein